jgi:hypothetical protein
MMKHLKLSNHRDSHPASTISSRLERVLSPSTSLGTCGSAEGTLRITLCFNNSYEVNATIAPISPETQLISSCSILNGSYPKKRSIAGKMLANPCAPQAAQIEPRLSINHPAKMPNSKILTR